MQFIDKEDAGYASASASSSAYIMTLRLNPPPVANVLFSPPYYKIEYIAQNQNAQNDVFGEILLYYSYSASPPALVQRQIWVEPASGALYTISAAINANGDIDLTFNNADTQGAQIIVKTVTKQVAQ